MDVRKWSDYVEIHTGDLVIRWRGWNTANVFLYGREVDCFTFDHEHDEPSFDVFAAAARAYLADVDVVEMGA